MTEYGRIHADGSRSGGQPVVTTGLDRSIEQFFFEVGYVACFADAFIKNGVVPFELTDAIVERAWAIAPQAHEDGAEFYRYLAAAQALRQPTQSDDCPKCDKLGDDCGEHAPSWEELAAYWKAENEQLRHDLERQMTIANEHVNEVERLREALAQIAFSGADGPYGEFGEALNEHQMRRVAKAALEQSK